MAFDFGAGLAGMGNDPLNPLGGLIGGGLFGGKQKFDMSGINDLITQRQAQIDQFANQLEMARGNVLSNYQNLNQNTMKAFMPQYEANLAGRGLNVAGGAFASGVGREATNLQSNYDMLNTQLTENNLNTIAKMRQDLFGQNLGMTASGMEANYNINQAYNQNMAKGIGNLGIAGPINSILGQSTGGQWQLGSIFGGGQSQSANSIYGQGSQGGGMNQAGLMALLAKLAPAAG